MEINKIREERYKCELFIYNMCKDRSQEIRNCVLPRCCGICTKLDYCDGICEFFKKLFDRQ